MRAGSGEEIGKTYDFKLRLHERFFACDGDAIFLKLSRRQRAAKITRVATLWRSPWFCRKKFNSLNFSRFFSAIFSSVASPVRGWLHMRFSPRAGDATIFKKIASPSQAKNRSCSRGFMRARADSYSSHYQRARGHKTIGSHLNIP